MLKFKDLTKYSTREQKIVFWLGIFFSIIAGVMGAFVAVVIGEGVAVFDIKNGPDEMIEAINRLVIICAVVGLSLWTFATFSFALTQTAAENLVFELRHKYLSALMLQETEFFEK